MKFGRIAAHWSAVPVLFILFSACGYEPPGTTSGNAASSSSGKGGAGAGETSASSSSGDGGMGGLLSTASSSAVTGSVASAASSGSGGNGGAGPSSGSSGTSSSGSNSSSSSGNPDPTVTCGGGFECPTTGTGVCCASKTQAGIGTCDPTGECKLGGTGVYKLKCDEKADCPAQEFCCVVNNSEGTACQLDCGGQTVCKDTADCPAPEMCPQKSVPLNLCVQ